MSLSPDWRPISAAGPGSGPSDDDSDPVTLKRGASTFEGRRLKEVPDPDSGRPSRVNSIVVTFKRGITPSVQALATSGAGAVSSEDLGGGRIRRLKVASGDVPRVLARLRAMPEVEAAEPDLIYRATFNPNDPCISGCSVTNPSPPPTTINESQWGLSQVNAMTAWDTSRSSSSVRIAILDCGILSASSVWGDTHGFPDGHPDIAPKVIAEIDFTSSTHGTDDFCGHGTMTSGTAAAVTDNGIGIAGVAPNASIVNVKVLSDAGTGDTGTLARGILWAAGCDTDPCGARRAEIISMSLGATGPCPTALQAAIDLAWGQGMVLVAAAGNSNSSTGDNPADCNHVIAVGASTETGAKASFSNFGSGVAVAAPGQHLPAPDFVGGYSDFTGTSASTPYVSGVMALLWITTYNTGNQALVDRLYSTANSAMLAGSVHGIVDAAAAVSGGDPNPPTNPTLSSSSHTVNATSANRRIVITWPALGQSGGATDDRSGVAGFSWTFSQSENTVPDTTVDSPAATTTVSSPLLEDGSWWFHLRTRDNAGNWSAPVHIGPFPIAGLDGTVWYFAEGFTGNGWETYTYFLNDGNAPATVEATYLLLGGATVTKTFTMPAQTRRRLFANNLSEGPGTGQAFGMRIVADHPITAQQSLVDTSGNLGHGSVGSKVLSTSWYFAEGFSGNGWLTFVSATNPGDAAADVTTTYHKTDGTATVVTKTIPPHSRDTFAGHEDVPGSAFSIEVHSTLPIVSQEVLIDTVGLLAHGTIGSTTLSTQWYFSEGYTGDSWLTFISVGNIGTSAAHVSATYSLFGGSPVTQTQTVPAGTRFTFAGHETATGVGTGQSFGVSVSADQPIVSQEVLIDPKTGVALAHGVIGAPSLGTSFTFAGGTAQTNWLTFVSVTNPGSTGGMVTATYYFDSGSPVTRTQPIGANQRITFASTDSTGPGVSVPYAVKITSSVPVISQEVVIDLTRYLAYSAAGTTN
jgi:thermitase